MAFPKGIVWTVQPFWSHHPRYPLPEVRVAAPCVDGDFRVEACSASATSSTQTSASLCPYQHYAHLHCPIHFRLPTFSRTMHHTSSQKGLRSGWQSGAMVAAWKRLPSARKLFYFFKYAILRHSPEVTRDIVLCFNIIYFRLVWYDMPLHIPFTILLICFKK